LAKAVLSANCPEFAPFVQAINTVIQGSAADMMKTAMIHLSTNLMRWQDEATRPRML
jgi:DNA polymerase I-like protein with 3'-5' exonuclease and polymerase domains